jgi:hypothetical protein
LSQAARETTQPTERAADNDGMLTAEQSLFLAALYARVAIWIHREEIERRTTRTGRPSMQFTTSA